MVGITCKSQGECQHYGGGRATIKLPLFTQQWTTVLTAGGGSLFVGTESATRAPVASGEQARFPSVLLCAVISMGLFGVWGKQV